MAAISNEVEVPARGLATNSTRVANTPTRVATSPTGVANSPTGVVNTPTGLANTPTGVAVISSREGQPPEASACAKARMGSPQVVRLNFFIRSSIVGAALGGG